MSKRSFNAALAAGIAAARAGRWALAREWLQRTVAAQPDSVVAWLCLAAVAESDVERRACWRRVLALDPHNPKALAALATPPPLPALLERGQQAARAGRLSEARQYLAKTVYHYPNSETAWLWLAAVLPAGSRRITALKRVLQLNPDNELAWQAHIHLTYRPPASPNAYLAQRQPLPVLAAPQAHEALLSQPDAEPVAFHPPIAHPVVPPVGEPAVSEPLPLEALVSRPEARPNVLKRWLTLALPPATPQRRLAFGALAAALAVVLVFGLGQLSFGVRPPAAPAGPAQVAIETTPRSIATLAPPPAPTQTAAAAPTAAAMPTLDPVALARQAEAHYLIAQDLAAQGDFAAAVADYDRALALDPNMAQAYADRGYAYAQLTRLHGAPDYMALALADHQHALQLAPQLANALIGRGFDVQFQCGQSGAGASVFNASSALQPAHGGGDCSVEIAYAAQPAGQMALAASWRPIISQWARPIERQTQRYGLAPDLVASIIRAESQGDPDAISRLGAIGLMQVVPREGGIDWRPAAEELRKPYVNLWWGAALLTDILWQAGGDIQTALEAYSGGWEMVGSEVGLHYTLEVMGYFAENGAAERDAALNSEAGYGLVQIVWDEIGRERIYVIRRGPLSRREHVSLAALVLYEPAAARGHWLPLYELDGVDSARTLRSAVLVVPAGPADNEQVAAGYSD